MKLLRVHIIDAQSCGGLLDGLDVSLRRTSESHPLNAKVFEPLCLIGPNGAGKSQFIQIVAEAFQSLLHSVVPKEERAECNRDLQFEIEYLISVDIDAQPVHVKATRRAEGRRKSIVSIAKRIGDEWIECDLADPSVANLLPSKVIGYTSGANETLSLPFLVSRSAYADEVGRLALQEKPGEEISVPDTRLMLVDYGTHLEVLVANLILGSDKQREGLLEDARVEDLHSVRCVVQLAQRKEIKLTQELESYLDQLRRCATSHHHDPGTESYVFDFFVNGETRKAFGHFWKTSLELYAAFHKLAMLNDLAISKAARTRFRKETQLRKFAARLPEPQDEDKVFRFESVVFDGKDNGVTVDYVSLSDGEHQMAQLLGTMCMVSFRNALFLLDEPESHFNPKWRVKLLSKVMALPTEGGARQDSNSVAALQDGLLTTHSPFVASDMHKERVFIFSKHPESGDIAVRHPDIETFGTTFDAILAECFDIRPPISDVSMAKIDELKNSNDPEKIQKEMGELGDSVEKIMLADRVRQLKRQAIQ